MKARFSRTVVLIALVLSAIMILSACGGSKKTAEPTHVAQPRPTEAAQAQPTKPPMAVPTKAPTATKKPEPTIAPSPTSRPEAETSSFKKITANERKLLGELADLDSYKVNWEIKFSAKLKDGGEKTSAMTMKLEVVNKPRKKSRMTMGGSGMMQSGVPKIAVIRVGDDAWIDMGGGTWIHVPAQQVESMTGSMVTNFTSEAYVGNEFKKGTKKIGPLECNVYEFDKSDVLRMLKIYPSKNAPEEIKSAQAMARMEGNACVTKNYIPLMSHVEMASSDPKTAMGLDDEALQSMLGVTSKDIKELVITTDESVTDINKKFDIQPPETGG